MILTGDIGATNTRLALFAEGESPLRCVAEETFRSQHYPNLDVIVQKFIASRDGAISSACFGVAGPVQQGRCETTNLAWVVDAAVLASVLGIEQVWLINDLEATAHGIAMLTAADWLVLNAGTPDAVGNSAVIAAGTGLGEAGLHWDGKAYQPFACEGGHTDFAPRNELEIELLRYLLARFGHVSYERVLSGPGLQTLYQFFRDTGRGVEPQWLAGELAQRDPAAVIAQAGLAEKNELCVQALNLFAALYGAEAGNLALKVMATGGVFIGGGIAPKILPKLQEPFLLEAFFAKGRMRPLLEAMPMRVITNLKTALFGAARFVMARGRG
jgi:glucokinase